MQSSAEARALRIAFSLVFASLCCRPALGQDAVNADATRRANLPRLAFNRMGHVASIRALTFDPDGEFLYSGGTDKAVHVWRVPKAGDDEELKLIASVRPNHTPNGGLINFVVRIPRGSPDAKACDLAVGGEGFLGLRGDFQIFRSKPDIASLSFALAQHVIHDGPGIGAVETDCAKIERQFQEYKGHYQVLTGARLSPQGKYLMTHQRYVAADYCKPDDRLIVWKVPDGDGKYEHHLTVDEELNIVAGDFSNEETIFYVTNNGNDNGNDTFEIHRQENKPGGIAKSWKIPWPEPIKDIVVSASRNKIRIFDRRGAVLDYNADDCTRVDQFGNLSQGTRVCLAVATSPDMDLVALSLRHANMYLSDVMVIDTTRQRPTRVYRAAGYVESLAFHPDGKRLAIGGGPANDVVLLDIDRLPAENAADAIVIRLPSRERAASGSTIWAVGFESHDQERAFPRLVFSHDLIVQGRPAPEWLRFDTQRRRLEKADNAPDQIKFKEFEGWKFSPTLDGNSRPFVTDPQGNPVPLDNVPLTVDGTLVYGRLNEWTFIPPNVQANHPSLSIATCFEGGQIVVHRLPEGTRTHELVDHQSGVRSLAVSKDGRWLLSGSSDQSMRLWPLAGIDQLRDLGLTLRQENAQYFVQSVRARSAADREFQLRPNDRIESVTFQSRNAGQPPEHVLTDLKLLDETVTKMGAGDGIKMAYFRDGVRIESILSRLFEKPALGFFPSVKRDWVLWTPEGYYDTSVLGDENLLGWHRNRVVVRNDAFPELDQDAAFYPISRYESQLRKKELIDSILFSADPAQAFPAVQVDNPPRILVSRTDAPNRPPVILDNDGAADLGAINQTELKVEVFPDDGHTLVGEVVVRQDGRKLPPEIVLPGGSPRLEFRRKVELASLTSDFSVEARDESGARAVRSFSLSWTPPEPKVVRRPRLVLRAIGVSDFDRLDSSGGDIPYADADAVAITDGIDGRVQREKAFVDDRIDVESLTEKDATHSNLRHAFESLLAMRDQQELAQGDTVVVTLVSHLLANKMLLSVDADGSDESALDVSFVRYALASLADTGCRVLLILNGYHNEKVFGQSSNFMEFVRALGRDGVFVLFADENEKSVVNDGNHCLSSAIVRVCETETNFSELSVDDFAAKVGKIAEVLSGRRNYPRLRVPDTLGARVERVRIFRAEGAAK